LSYSLDDIKRASESNGADLIVFSDLRSKAADARKEIDARKDAIERIQKSTQEIKKPKKKALSALTVASLALEDEKKLLATITSGGGEVYTKPIDDAIKEYQEQFDKATAEIEGYNKQLDELIKVVDELVEYRNRERDAYKDAKSQYNDLKSNPERALGSNPSDEDKEQLEQYVDSIMGKMEAEEDGHEDQIVQVQNWKNNLTAARNATKASEVPSD
jgi:chromosome segregation ATPase